MTRHEELVEAKRELERMRQSYGPARFDALMNECPEWVALTSALEDLNTGRITEEQFMETSELVSRSLPRLTYLRPKAKP